MNIQLPVILWTVICFSLLTVILDRLLFRPVMKILDERQKKLTCVRQEKESRNNLIQERAEQRELMIADLARQKEAEIRRSLDSIHVEEKQRLKEAHKECLQRIEVYRDQREKELEEILVAVSPRIAQAADLFVRQIVPDED